MHTFFEITFFAAAALLLYHHIGYPILLRLVVSGGDEPAPAPGLPDPLPSVSLIVAGHNEAEVIGARVTNALALDYPRELLQLIVVDDGSTDGTADVAEAAGADAVLRRAHEGKVAGLNQAVAELATGDVLAFSDANSAWEHDALRRLVAALAVPDTGYVCGQVAFRDASGDNQEGLYWRYEMAIRTMESQLAGVTSGNGAINALWRRDYIALEPDRGQDISMPFEMTRRGLRATYAADALATEALAADITGEFGRKRRMAAGGWRTLLSTRMLDPSGVSGTYAWQMWSHRLLRYIAPFLHLLVFIANIALLGDGWFFTLTFLLQLGVIAGAVGAKTGRVNWRLAQLCRYYLTMLAAAVLGLVDYLRHGVPTTWGQAEGTRG